MTKWRELDAARRYCDAAQRSYTSAVERKDLATEELTRAKTALNDAANRWEEARRFLQEAEQRNEVVEVEGGAPSNVARSEKCAEMKAQEGSDDEQPLPTVVTPDSRARRRSREGNHHNEDEERGSAPSARRRLDVSSATDSSDDAWMEGFEHFLLTVPHGQLRKTLSEANARTVLRQVRVLASGQGVSYKHWGRGVLFAPGRSVNLSTDLDALHAEAVAFERRYGKDKGNGWLLRHPIKKMRLYQKYLRNRNEL